MKIPKTIKMYCEHCKTHTIHKVVVNKRKTARSMSYGSKVRAKLRGRARGHGNLGRYSKPAISNFKMTGKKQTKKTDLRYICEVCHKSSIKGKGKRTKRLELV